MTSSNMNFGPEWMRRFPAKSSSQAGDLRMSSPLQEWSSSTAAASSAAQPPATPTSVQPSSNLPAFSYSSVAAHNTRAAGAAQANVSSSSSSSLDATLDTPSDTLNPFKYSKDFMLSLFKPVGVPIEFERHDYVTSEDPLMPMASQPFTEQELKILSGSVNSEVVRRVPQEGGQERGPGQRRESLSSHDQSKDRDYSGRNDKGSHSRNHDKFHGSNSRSRNLNNDDRHHSHGSLGLGSGSHSKRAEHRDEDGLWNSPVKGNTTVGSFDANGVFRIATQDGEELGALSEKDDSDHEATDKGGAGPKVNSLESGSKTNSSAAALSPKASESGSNGRPRALDNDSLPLEEKLAGTAAATETQESYPLASSVLNSINLDQEEEDEFSPFGGSEAIKSNATVVPAASAVSNAPVELSNWLYRDPTGSIQGPFRSEEMHEWYKGGFFTMDLLVKREQDPTFEPLGSLIRRVGSDDRPFLVAGLIRQEIRPALSLPQRPNLGNFSQQGSWGGLSAPTTPSAPAFGVDRLFMQQQQQQQQQGDIMNSGGGNPQIPGQDPMGSFGGFGPGLFARTPVEAGGMGWGGDMFSRGGGPGMQFPGSQMPMQGHHFVDQRLFGQQQLERQQYLQMLQRQSQMQQIMHQQQFMAAQQQYGNDRHALAALLQQQQQEQRQLQLRQQQLQQAIFASAVSTPGGTMMPWGGLGQPSSPWSTSIIQLNNDNYFDYNKSPPGPLSMQQQQQQQQPQPQQPQDQPPEQHQQQGNVAVEHHTHAEQHVQTMEAEVSQIDNSIDTVVDSVDKLNVQENAHNEYQEQEEPVAVPEQQQDDSVKEDTVAVEIVSAEESVDDEDVEQAAEDVKEDVEEAAVVSDGKAEPSQEVIEDDKEEQGSDSIAEAVGEEDKVEETTPAAETSAPSTATSTPIPEPRVIKASPAPWAKTEEATTEKRGPTLREIQEMEAKRSEAQKAAERQAAAAALAAAATTSSSLLPGTGGSPWQTAAAPKKKTLREIQEEEAALQRQRSAAQASAAAAAAAAAVSPIPSASSGSSTGLAAIVASNSGAKTYADRIGPKAASTSSPSGPWSMAASTSIKSAIPATRTAPAYASAPTTGAARPGAPTASKVDNQGWTEVGRGGSQPSSQVTSPSVSRSPAVSKSISAAVSSSTTNSNEPRPPSDEFLRWCRQALSGLHDVVLDDFIQMLLSFPLNPDPMTVEIIQDSIYANSKSLDGRRFADEFIRRRKADAFPSTGGGAAFGASVGGVTPGSNNPHQHDNSFKVVTKKGKKKGTA